MTIVASGQWRVAGKTSGRSRCTLAETARKIGIGVLFAVALFGSAALPLWAQSTAATVTGEIADQTGKVVPSVMVTFTNINTGVLYSTQTNGSGIYVLSTLQPGIYRANVTKDGFKGIVKPDIELHVQDQVSINFSLQVGSVSETVTVEAGGIYIDTTDAAVSTVIDRQFVANIPLNGRSFQDLVTLAPGVALVSSTYGAGASGEITVNGQRTEANYFTVDGVAANTGTYLGSQIFGAGYSGGVPAETVLGTTQSLVSIDALQEFRSSTSTYSAEYGRTPGGQFSLSTRSGTNEWHGSVFDYFRNDALDANNWFNNAATPAIPKQAERQNDFGGTVGGPVVIPGLYNGKDKTFFFFSYEGLRLLTPQPSHQYSVPDLCLRDATNSCTGTVVSPAYQALRPFLNAFPLPSKDKNGNYIEDGMNDGLGLFNQVYSAPSSLDNVGIRLDHHLSGKISLFGRYSETESSSWSYSDAAIKTANEVNVKTLTLGATSLITGKQVNELRFNVTQNDMNNTSQSTNFGGAVPLDITSFPGPNGQPLQARGAELSFGLFFGISPFVNLLQNTNEQRQFNVTDTYSWSTGAHQLKFGIDWRRLGTLIYPLTTSEYGYFFNESSVLSGQADLAGNLPNTTIPVEPIYHNLSTFVQDEWKATPRLSVSLGLRWDVNPSPGNLNGPLPFTVDQITDLASTKLAPQNTPLWKTDWLGLAPRLGVAYELSQRRSRETVIRGGFGLFYDMGNAQGSTGFFQSIGFSSEVSYSSVDFPLTSAQLALPPPSTAAPYNAAVVAFDPNLKLPYTMEWNAAIEQALGSSQSLTIGYVGSVGRRLLSSFFYSPSALGNTNFGSGSSLEVTSNRAASSYNALQLKYDRKLSRGLRALASYTWSHSIDNASTNFGLNDALLRGSSNFDIRHNFQTALTYDVPGSYHNALLSAALKHWGIDTRISARSALPVDIQGAFDINPVTEQRQFFHPDLVPGQPIYLYGSQYPGGRIFNYNAFTPAPSGIDGDSGRNSLRDFNAWQVDLAVRRDFPIRERLHIQFRAEAFNVFNHPNFSNIDNSLSDGPYNPVTHSGFGGSQSTLNNSLGGLNALYQVGGPRSLQIALKLVF